MNKVCVYYDSFSSMSSHEYTVAQYLLCTFDEVWLIPKDNKNFDLSKIENFDQRIKLKVFNTNFATFIDMIEDVQLYNKDSKIVNRLYFLVTSAQFKTVVPILNKAYFTIIYNSDDKITVSKPHILLNDVTIESSDTANDVGIVMV